MRPIRYVRDLIYNWLEDSDSIQFDTDIPLEDCLRRLRTMAANPAVSRAMTLREFELEPVDETHYRLSIRLASFPRVRLDALLWEDEGITFVNGEAILYRKYWLYLLAFTVILVLMGPLITSRTDFMVLIVSTVILFVMGLYSAVQPITDYRTMLINLVYDTLDHEQITRPEAFYIVNEVPQQNQQSIS